MFLNWWKPLWIGTYETTELNINFKTLLFWQVFLFMKRFIILLYWWQQSVLYISLFLRIPNVCTSKIWTTITTQMRGFLPFWPRLPVRLQLITFMSFLAQGSVSKIQITIYLFNIAAYVFLLSDEVVINN